MIHRAKKSLGQNFLKSEAALRKIIEAGEVNSDDVILEIGPGKGTLTARLLERAGVVVAVEKDRELVEFLWEKFKEEIRLKKLILTEGDILKINPPDKGDGGVSYKIIANIPYNITGAILKKFLTAKNQPECMVLMLQHEVAQRIMGRPASARGYGEAKKESILSISVKAYGEPKLIMKVPARYFSPAPKVDSAIISINNISRKIFEKNGINEGKFWEIVKMGFAHKRKKLSSNLKPALKSGEVNLAPDLRDKRAEDLTLSDWISLAK